jgi:hypothetical protein
MKKSFLVVYDYGMGGAWAIIAACSEEEITSKFPMLKVMTRRPDWMTQEEYDEIASEGTYDIDQPTGWLKTLMAHPDF